MSAPLDRPLYGASWGDAIARFFANYSVFRGRASPSEYWWWALTNALIATAINIAAVCGERMAGEICRSGFPSPEARPVRSPPSRL